MWDLAKTSSRSLIIKLGARSRTASRLARTAARYTTLGQWAAQFGDLPPGHANRYELFASVVPEVRSADRLVYLEFGVYNGDTLRWWTEQIGSPEARFVGFDSFEGLPEAWESANLGAGAFSVDAVPEFDDQRVSLVQGWFDDTVPDFEVPEHDRLVVSVDSDLYSSAVTVLTAIGPHLRSGDFIYFDELADLEHEFRALNEFTAATSIELEPWGMADGGIQWMFRVR